MGAPGVAAFWRHLAVERKVSASAHKVALSALLYLYREVLSIDLPWMEQINRPHSDASPLQQKIGRVPILRKMAGVHLQMSCMPSRSAAHKAEQEKYVVIII